MTSCDKKDCNGPLDGMWQLTLWTQQNGERLDTLATKENMIFYSFQLQMMKVANKCNGVSYFAIFENHGDMVRVYDPFTVDVENPGHDKMFPMSELLVFGIPEDGHLDVEHLTSKELILKSSCGRMTFRKY